MPKIVRNEFFYDAVKHRFLLERRVKELEELKIKYEALEEEHQALEEKHEALKAKKNSQKEAARLKSVEAKKKWLQGYPDEKFE